MISVRVAISIFRMQGVPRTRKGPMSRCALIIFLLVFCWQHTGCIDSLERSREGAPIGVLLPFTGDLAAGGYNLERAVLMAAEDVNTAHGIGGLVHIVTADTHSDVQRGMQSAENLIHNQKVISLIGPENTDIIKQMIPLVEQADLVQLLPGLTAPEIMDGIDPEEDDLRWFRLSPSVEMIGCTLAKRMYADGVRKVGLLYEPGDYTEKLADNVSRVFEDLDGDVVLSVDVLQPGKVSECASLAPDAVVLLAFPLVASSVLRDWAVMGTKTQWYFAPMVNTDAFMLNVPPGLVDGAVGVSPSIPFRSVNDFNSKFRARWFGDAPFDAAYFYYDALVVLAFAMESMRISGAGDDTLGEHILRVSGPPGTIVDWDDLGLGFSLLSQGQQINYRGASGTVDFKPNGDIDSGLLQFWTVRDHTIQATSLSPFVECLK